MAKESLKKNMGVSTDPALVQRIDDAAWERRMNRSQFVSQALQTWLDYQANGPLPLPAFGSVKTVESDKVTEPVLVVPPGFKVKVV